jgi:RNA polymerase subunit RPABC4/transcription elongation factor Spt4
MIIMADTMKKCATCGVDIAKSAKACPQCGAKNKKPITKRWWFWAIIIVFVLGIISNLAGGDDNTTVSSTQSSGNAQSSSSVASSTQLSDSTSSAAPAQVEQKPDPIVVDVDTLMDTLKANALNASNTYKGAYVEVTGRLSTIDSSGKYFSILPFNDDWAFVGVQCFITKEQQDIVAGFTKDQSVTVIGTITDVGEVLGYSLKVESIE